MSSLELSYRTIGPASVALSFLVFPSLAGEFPSSQSVIVQDVFLDEALRDGMRNPSQSYYWTEEWQEAEREAMEELRRGEYESFASGAEAVQWLIAD